MNITKLVIKLVAWLALAVGCAFVVVSVTSLAIQTSNIGAMRVASVNHKENMRALKVKYNKDVKDAKDQYDIDKVGKEGLQLAVVDAAYQEKLKKLKDDYKEDCRLQRVAYKKVRITNMNNWENKVSNALYQDKSHVIIGDFGWEAFNKTTLTPLAKIMLTGATLLLSGMGLMIAQCKIFGCEKREVKTKEPKVKKIEAKE